MIACTGLLLACKPERTPPEPHLVLGQKILFNGSDPDKTYVIIGYRHKLEGTTDKIWNNHDYIVFLYINDTNDVKEAVIHKNAIIKQ